jgi:hypothetical protein
VRVHGTDTLVTLRSIDRAVLVGTVVDRGVSRAVQRSVRTPQHRG